jgi:hypothetical protein
MRREPPWWLTGSELCPHCEQRYALEMEVRCVDCDAPACPLCVVHVRARRVRVCPPCDSAAARVAPAQHRGRGGGAGGAARQERDRGGRAAGGGARGGRPAASSPEAEGEA